MPVIFDLDGTLADIRHRLHFIKDKKHKNFDKFHAACVDDKVNTPIAIICNRLYFAGEEIFIVSGRSAVVREETERWLDQKGIRYHRLFMRSIGDYTPDHELKREWLRSGRLGPFSKILCTFDDRQRVVDMWREEGITCLQVDAWKE